MALWSTKRKFLYGSSFIIILVLVLAGVAYGVFYKTPTCSDGKQNGDEAGIDCGGACKLLCTSDALTPIVLWSKIFPVSGNLYTAVAYIQNPNINSKNSKASYQFQFFDANNNLIGKKSGTTSIPKNKKFAVFEVGIILKDGVPKSADFAFTSLGAWEKDTTKERSITIVNSTLLGSSTAPRVEGTVTNNSLTENIPSLELDALVLDSDENVIGASRTFVDNLTKNSSQDFVFTWPQPFLGQASVVSVTYR